jgi:hypothetical protein
MSIPSLIVSRASSVKLYFAIAVTTAGLAPWSIAAAGVAPRRLEECR